MRQGNIKIMFAVGLAASKRREQTRLAVLLAAMAILCCTAALANAHAFSDVLPGPGVSATRAARRRWIRIRGQKGLRNVAGSNCYVSSLIQMLRVSDWQQNVRRGEDPARCALFLLLRSDGQDGSAGAMTQFLSKLPTPFDGRTQQSVDEFFLQAVLPLFEDSEHAQIQTSVTQTKQCTVCRTVATQVQHYPILILHPNDNGHSQSVGGMLDVLSSPRTLSDIDCDVCKTKTLSHFQDDIRVSDDQSDLIFFVSCFKTEINALPNGSIHVTCRKLHHSVDVPKTIVVSGKQLHLRACVLHSGETLESGHYVSLCVTENGWKLYDDEREIVAEEADLSRYQSVLLLHSKTEHPSEEDDIEEASLNTADEDVFDTATRSFSNSASDTDTDPQPPQKKRKTASEQIGAPNRNRESAAFKLTKVEEVLAHGRGGARKVALAMRASNPRYKGHSVAGIESMLKRWTQEKSKLQEDRTKNTKLKSSHKGKVSKYASQEQTLVEWILYRRRIFATITASQCFHVFLSLCKKTSLPQPKNMEKWWTRFRRSYKISTRRVGSFSSVQIPGTHASIALARRAIQGAVISGRFAYVYAMDEICLPLESVPKTTVCQTRNTEPRVKVVTSGAEKHNLTGILTWGVTVELGDKGDKLSVSQKCRMNPVVVWQGPRTETKGRGRPSVFQERNKQTQVHFTCQKEGKCDYEVMMEYVKTLPVLSSGRWGLLILDGYKSHYSVNVVKESRSRGWLIFIIPPNCSSHLNVGDQTGCNRKVRRVLQSEWSTWSAEKLLAGGLDKLPRPSRNELCDWMSHAYYSVRDQDIESAFDYAWWPNKSLHPDIHTPISSQAEPFVPSEDIQCVSQEVATLADDFLDDDDIEILEDIEVPGRGSQWGFATVVLAPKYEVRIRAGERVRVVVEGETEEVVQFKKCPPRP